jgi:hypothetical protein
VISISPKVPRLLLERGSKVDHHTQSCLRVSLGWFVHIPDDSGH